MTRQISPSAAFTRLWSFVPSGGSLPEPVWRSRRRFLVGLTWFHAAVIALSGFALGYRWELSLDAPFRHGTVLHTFFEAAIVAMFAALAGWRESGRTFQATAVGFGLMSSSAILVHLSGGYIELHFHFFVMLAFLALFQDWIPYLLAVGFVALHHGVVGVLWPQEVFNHAAAFESPWLWAAIHAGFVLCACVGSVIAWRFNEHAFAQTALILEAAGEGIFGLDVQGKVSFINPAAAALLGTTARRSVGQLLGRILKLLNADGTTVPEEASPVLAPLADGVARRATDTVFGRPDGSKFPVDYVSTPMIERGHITGVVVSFQDITERKRAEADLQRSHRRLEETLAELQTTQKQMLQQERLRAVGQMASGIAHDFNNSLSPIVGFSELLLRRPEWLDDKNQVATYLQLINTAARDAASVVRRLRELYRDQGAGGATSAADLQRCVEEAIALTQPRWKSQALASGVTIQIETDVANVRPVAGDSAEIREILTNLIFNAVDAMAQGGTITIRGREDGDDVRFEVSDTGAGMTPEVLERCREPFFSTKGSHGSGLGLSMVHAIVERHGGSCDIESAPGAGTTFAVRLPVRTRPVVAAPDVEPLDRGRRLRILVVEDEPRVRKTITEQLTSVGHTVDSATNGLEGLEKLLNGWFDVIVTDRAMPEMNGDQFAAAVQRLAPNKPVIMLTGFGDLMAAKGQRPAGVSLVISKPITLDALTQAIAEVTASPSRL